MKRIAIFLMLMSCVAFCGNNILLNPTFSELNPQKTAPLHWHRVTPTGVAKSTPEGVVISNPTAGTSTLFTQQLRGKIEIGMPYTFSAKIKAEKETEVRFYIEYTRLDAEGKIRYTSFGSGKINATPNWTEHKIAFNVPIEPRSIYIALGSNYGVPVTFKDLDVSMSPNRKAMGGYWNLDNQVEIVEDGIMATRGKPGQLMRVPVEAGKTYKLTYIAQGIGETGNDYPFHEIVVHTKPYGISGGYFFNDVRNVPMPKLQKLVIPAKANYKTIDIQFNANTKGKVHFYDFNFSEYVPDPKDSWRFFIDEPYHRDIIYSSHDAGKVAGTIAATAPAATAVVNFEGKPEVTVTLKDGKGTFEIPAKNLPNGKYGLTCKLLDADGKELKSFARTIAKVPKAKYEVIGTRSRYYLFNDKPFFPIQEWTMPYMSNDAALYNQARNGFNCVSIIIGTDNKRTKELFDRLDSFGVKAIVVSDCFTTMSPKEHASLRERLEAKMPLELRQHPAFLAYFMVDEPLWGGRPSAPLAATLEMLKDFDPYHPVWINAAPRNEVEDLIPYGEACDIFGVDIYPIPYPNSHSGLDDKGITSVGKYTRRMLDTTFWRKPNWMVLQGFAWASLRDGAPVSTWIYPNDTQMRFMAYDAMLNGATGYVLWGTHHIESQAFYDTIQKVSRELHAMSGLYVADCQGKDIATANPDVRVVPFTFTRPSSVFWPFSKKPAHYFAVMNMVEKDSTVTFATGLGAKEFTNYAANNVIAADNGNVTLTLKPYEVLFFGDAPLPKPAYELPKVRPELEKITEPIGKVLAEQLAEQQKLIANAEYYKGKANWIWNDVNKHIPSCRTLVTKSFDVVGTEQKAMLGVAVDDSSEVFLNGKSIGKTAGWNLLVQFDLTGKLQPGKNTVTILAEDGGMMPCGVLAELTIDGKVVCVTDASWLAKPLEFKQKYDPKDTDGFKPAFIITPYGSGAWGHKVMIKK